jgi:hypothetical protein
VRCDLIFDTPKNMRAAADRISLMGFPVELHLIAKQ